MTVAGLAAIIHKMHFKQRVIHRNICLDSVGMRVSNSEPCGYSIKRLSGTEYATCLKQKIEVVHRFKDGPRMAPEVEAGKPHGFSVDVWSLG